MYQPIASAWTKGSESSAELFCIGAAISLAAPVANASAAADPLLETQWALSDPAAIGAQEAWTQSTGAGVLVAVLDTGVQLNHPDLAANIWTNPGEIAGNGIDDDKSGVVDDVHGANMFDGTNNVEDDNGHGTHVAGIVAARQGNGVGGSGIAPEAKILPVKVLDANMAGNTDALSIGIRYAVDRGAKILNISVNTNAPTDTVDAAVRYAGQHGAVIVASAGNDGRNIDLQPSYPASLADPAVFSVAAQDEDGLLWQLSNTGLLSVDLAAPGAHIASTTRGSTYQSRSGTSAAAPFVAGSLALLSAARPDLPIGVLRTAITDTTKRTSLLNSLLGDAAPRRRRRDAPRARRPALADRERGPHRGGSEARAAHEVEGAGGLAGHRALDRDRRGHGRQLARLAGRPRREDPACHARRRLEEVQPRRSPHLARRRLRRRGCEGRRRQARVPGRRAVKLRAPPARYPSARRATVAP